ncbi:MAG: PfkB family carbohydrate kinase [Steroidobacteraceae bacterium]|jgi:sulfofructose kinase|nr:PfkB family carbohydrate kinase [Steroidobacteraceae bacterium]
MALVLCVGHAVQDFVFAVPRLPDRGEKYRATGFESVGGGPAATAAVAIARLGGRARLAARVGDDAVAGVVIDELERYGVDCSLVRRFAGCSTSLSAVMVDGAGERMIVNHLDPRLPREAEWLPEPAALGVAAVLGDVRWPEGSAVALARAKAAGLPAVLDADRPIPVDGALLRCASHVAFSADGLADHAGEADPARALERVGPTLDAWSCVTAGADGVYTWDPRRGALEHQPAFRVEVVDTLGAGDVWHGAFALALAEGRTESAAVRFAQAAAALKVQRFGGRTGAPTRADLEHFLETR